MGAVAVTDGRSLLYVAEVAPGVGCWHVRVETGVSVQAAASRDADGTLHVDDLGLLIRLAGARCARKARAR